MGFFGKPSDNYGGNTPEENSHNGERFNFNRYFLAERRMALENISYELQKMLRGTSSYKLRVNDTFVSQMIEGKGAKVNFNRLLKFEPDGPFILSVTYSVLIVFNPGTKDEVDWSKIDIAKEFRENCPELCQNMMLKATMLIAQITNEATGTPFIGGAIASPRPPIHP